MSHRRCRRWVQNFFLLLLPFTPNFPFGSLLQSQLSPLKILRDSRVPLLRDHRWAFNARVSSRRHISNHRLARTVPIWVVMRLPMVVVRVVFVIPWASGSVDQSPVLGLLRPVAPRPCRGRVRRSTGDVPVLFVVRRCRSHSKSPDCLRVTRYPSSIAVGKLRSTITWRSCVTIPAIASVLRNRIPHPRSAR